MRVWTVTVFESGDMTTSVWGVYDSLDKAEKYKKELLADEDLNGDGYYLEIKVEEHKVN